jgi:hypothetical protein
MVVQRPSAIDQEPASHRRAAGRDRKAASEDSDHLPHVALGGDESAATQRGARSERDGRPACDVHDCHPAPGEYLAPRGRHKLLGAEGQGLAGTRRAPCREVVIQGRGQYPGQESISQGHRPGCVQ